MPSPSEDLASPVEATFSFIDIARAPLANVSAKLCKSVDIGCLEPVGAPYVSDAQGAITLPLHLGFRGYLDISPSETQPDLLPTIIYLPVLDAKGATNPTFHATLGSIIQLAFITQQADRPADPELGHIIFVISDCQGTHAADVSVRIEPANPEAYPFYFDANGTPSMTQTKTSTSGSGGIINVAPGVVAFVYERNGQRVGSQNVIIRQRGMSYVPADPTP